MAKYRDEVELLIQARNETAAGLDQARMNLNVLGRQAAKSVSGVNEAMGKMVQGIALIGVGANAAAAAVKALQGDWEGVAKVMESIPGFSQGRALRELFLGEQEALDQIKRTIDAIANAEKERTTTLRLRVDLTAKLAAAEQRMADAIRLANTPQDQKSEVQREIAARDAEKSLRDSALAARRQSTEVVSAELQKLNEQIQKVNDDLGPLEARIAKSKEELSKENLPSYVKSAMVRSIDESERLAKPLREELETLRATEASLSERNRLLIESAEAYEKLIPMIGQLADAQREEERRIKEEQSNLERERIAKQAYEEQKRNEETARREREQLEKEQQAEAERKRKEVMDDAEAQRARRDALLSAQSELREAEADLRGDLETADEERIFRKYQFQIEQARLANDTELQMTLERLKQTELAQAEKDRRKEPDKPERIPLPSLNQDRFLTGVLDRALAVGNPGQDLARKTLDEQRRTREASEKSYDQLTALVREINRGPRIIGGLFNGSRN